MPRDLLFWRQSQQRQDALWPTSGVLSTTGGLKEMSLSLRMPSSVRHSTLSALRDRLEMRGWYRDRV